MAAPGKPTEEGLAGAVRASLLEAGAAQVGFADLEPIPPEARRGFPRGVAFLRPLDSAVVAQLRDGPTADYHQEYDRANAELTRLADLAVELLRRAGHRCEPTAPTTVRVVVAGSDTTPLPHKTVATRAGLGWIGHSALLVTRGWGSAVRIGSVLTDAPLTVGDPERRSHCGTCRSCADACPAGAISGRTWAPGLARERFFDAGACREQVAALAAGRGIDVLICGICIHACPWTQRHLARQGAGR
jgi:epoxyqueuosine reductase QueG